MYRSMEPDFGKTMQGAMMGTVDNALEVRMGHRYVLSGRKPECLFVTNYACHY
jgi:hypothetical protein